MKPAVHTAFAAFLALAAATGARAAEAPPSPSSILALFNRIPDLPATAQDAASWVEKSGKLVEPGMLALAADIDAHQRAVGAIAASRNAHDQAQARVEDLGKGMADIGIDMERMQRDPAYAKQVQDRMRKMSPAELMAMSQKMSAPMTRDKRLTNEAQAMVDDAPAVRAAAAAGFAYSSEQIARMKAHEAIWREANEAVARINARRLTVAATKPAMAWDNIGCEAPCRVARPT